MPSEPDLQIGGLSLWVERRQYPDSSDYWDGNWLVVRVLMEAPGASVRCQGPILMTADFARFRDELAAAYERIAGEATLEGLEPDLRVVLKVDRLGRMAADVELNPDQGKQIHRFSLELDQSYIPPVLQSCERLLQLYPVVGLP